MGRYRHRLFLLTAIVAAPSVALLACNVFPGYTPLGNELPNRMGSPSGIIGGTTSTGGSGGASATGGGGGAGGSVTSANGGAGGSTGSGNTGTAASVCDVVKALNTSGTADCVNCAQSGAFCSGLYATCQNTQPECDTAIACAADAGASGTAINACLVASPVYAQWIECAFANCAGLCGWSPAISCPFDAGTD